MTSDPVPDVLHRVRQAIMRRLRRATTAAAILFMASAGLAFVDASVRRPALTLASLSIAVLLSIVAGYIPVLRRGPAAGASETGALDLHLRCVRRDVRVTTVGSAILAVAVVASSIVQRGLGAHTVIVVAVSLAGASLAVRGVRRYEASLRVPPPEDRPPTRAGR
jgi:hypothetical protein